MNDIETWKLRNFRLSIEMTCHFSPPIGKNKINNSFSRKFKKDNSEDIVKTFGDNMTEEKEAGLSSEVSEKIRAAISAKLVSSKTIEPWFFLHFDFFYTWQRRMIKYIFFKEIISTLHFNKGFLHVFHFLFQCENLEMKKNPFWRTFNFNSYFIDITERTWSICRRWTPWLHHGPCRQQKEPSPDERRSAVVSSPTCRCFYSLARGYSEQVETCHKKSQTRYLYSSK